MSLIPSEIALQGNYGYTDGHIPKLFKIVPNYLSLVSAVTFSH